MNLSLEIGDLGGPTLYVGCQLVPPGTQREETGGAGLHETLDDRKRAEARAVRGLAERFDRFS